MVMNLCISSYIRMPFLIYDFAPDPIWISLKRKILFSFLSVYSFELRLSCSLPSCKGFLQWAQTSSNRPGGWTIPSSGPRNTFKTTTSGPCNTSPATNGSCRNIWKTTRPPFSRATAPAYPPHHPDPPAAFGACARWSKSLAVECFPVPAPPRSCIRGRARADPLFGARQAGSGICNTYRYL